MRRRKPNRTPCATTGIEVDQCAHCPVPTAVDAPTSAAAGASTLPEPARAERQGAGQAQRPLTEPEGEDERCPDKMRERMGKPGSAGGWWLCESPWHRCATCRKRIAVGDPMRYVWGRTARDMAEQCWRRPCRDLSQLESRDVLRRRGYDMGSETTVGAEPSTHDDEPKLAAPPPGRGGAPTRRRGGGMLGV